MGSDGIQLLRLDIPPGAGDLSMGVLGAGIALSCAAGVPVTWALGSGRCLLAGVDRDAAVGALQSITEKCRDVAASLTTGTRSVEDISGWWSHIAEQAEHLRLQLLMQETAPLVSRELDPDSADSRTSTEMLKERTSS